MPRVTSRRAWPLRIAAVALIVGLAGCMDAGARDHETPTPDIDTTKPAPAAEPTAAARTVEPWTLTLPVIGQPVAAGGVAAVYVASDGVLSLVGVDARTGARLWTQPASPAYVVPGIAITPTVVHDREGSDYLAYFRPQLETNLNARLVVADPRTGEDVVATNGAVFTASPRSCDDGVDVCFETGYAGDGKSIQRLRISDGTVATEPRSNGYVRTIGPLGLSDVRTFEDEFLARVENGVELWRVALEESFGPGFSTDGGWSWRHHVDAGLLVGSAGR